MKISKNRFRFWMLPILAIAFIAGCEKRSSVTYPTGAGDTATVVLTSGTTVATAVTPPTLTVTQTATTGAAATMTVTMTGTTVVVNTATPTITMTVGFSSTVTATNTEFSTPTITSTVMTIPTPLPTTTGAVAQPTVNLGTSARFAVLSFSDLTDIPSCAIIGDVGISPGLRSNITGLLDGDGQVNAAYAIYAADDAGPVPAMLTAAYTDAGDAYLDAVNASRGTPTSISGNINGLTLAPGLYESGSSIEISPGGILYLDAQGDANAVFIIRSATSITTESTSEVVLAGSAQAKNIYWVAGSTITLGTNSIMKGTLIASTSISLLNMADLTGRAIIQSASAGMISLSQNSITLP